MSLLLIESGCPNCRGIIDEERLKAGSVCKHCLPEITPRNSICEVLVNQKKLKNLRDFCKAEKDLKDFSAFFEKSMGTPLLSLQKLWAKRVFMKDSFAMVAPTGTGKSTFGLVMTLFLKEKSLLIFPTKMLAAQSYERLIRLMKRAGIERKVLLYRSNKTSKEAFKNGDFEILLGTNMFLNKNFDTLKTFKFKFIFIDDVDSLLKSSKNTSKIFELLGFSKEEIALATKREKTEDEEKRLSAIRESKKNTVLIVSSATVTPKGNRIQLFKNLLGFSIQKAIVNLRNVLDVAEEVNSFEEALKHSLKIIRKFGKGGLVYVPIIIGKEGVKTALNFYKENGIRAISYDDTKVEDLLKILENDECDIVLGISHPGNPIVRGVDLPHIIKYTVFLGVPRHIFPIDISNKPSSLYSLLVILMELFDNRDKTLALKYIKYLKKYTGLREEDLEKYASIKTRVEKIREWLQEFLNNKEFLEKIEKSPDISLHYFEGKLHLVVADSSSYIQATGRTSRMVAGGLTRGFSILFYWDKKAFSSLRKRLSIYFASQDIEFRSLKEIDMDSVIKEIERDRERARLSISGDIPFEVKNLFRTTLVIVESPNKARTIAGFFGRPQSRLEGKLMAYEVPLGDRLLIITASLGHILDLVTDRGFFGVLNGDKFLPIYDTIKTCIKSSEQHTDVRYLKSHCDGEIRDKIDIVDGAKKIVFQVDEVYIATDPDSEGEKIAYDLYLLLRLFSDNIKRAEFHEIRPTAFRQAIEKPREFNINLVKAQMVRRILDRWVGFALSRVLWKQFGKNWLSAGRVQTPVLGWIIEREKATREKKGELILRINGYVVRILTDNVQTAQKVAENINSAKIYLSSSSIEEIIPPPPFTTDTILEEAWTKFRMDAKKVMMILQDLFEYGLITYHRTDSTRVSDAGKFQVARPYIQDKFGNELFYPRTWGTGGAHECIRPTRPIDEVGLRNMITAGVIEFANPQNAIKLYSLIFKRFIASQMRSVRVKKETLFIELPFFNFEKEVIIEVLAHGFDLIYRTFTIFNREEGIKIEKIRYRKVPAVPPFTQGSLIAEMKKRGLGRPSTYAHIVQTLLERGYVIEVKGWLHPTARGKKVYEFLHRNYEGYVSEELTKKLEDAMDRIEEGKLDWQIVLKEAYKIKDIVEW